MRNLSCNGHGRQLQLRYFPLGAAANCFLRAKTINWSYTSLTYTARPKRSYIFCPSRATSRRHFPRSYWWREKVYKQCRMNLWVDQVVRGDSGCGCTILPSNGPSTTTRCIRLRPGTMASCVFGIWYYIRPAQLAHIFLGRIVSCNEESRTYLYTPCLKKALDKFNIEVITTWWDCICKGHWSCPHVAGQAC